MQYDSKQNLAFLLSMAALPMAGCVLTSGDDDDDGAGTGSASNSNSNSNSNSDDGTTSGDDGTTSGGSLDDTGSDSIGESGSSGSADGTTGGETPAVCTEVGAHFDKCMITKPSPEEMVQECVYYVTYPANTPACTTANEDYYACLAMADCKALTSGKENPCQAEQDAIFVACEGEGTTGGGGEESSTGG